MLVSVVVPSFNQARYLSQTLQSLSDQIVNLEIIICDGGSRDGSVKIIQDFEAQMFRQPRKNLSVKWVSEKDFGQAHAINKGLLQSKGDILGYLNSDDVLYPEALTGIVHHFQLNPTCQIAYGQAHHLKSDGSILEEYSTEEWNYERFLENCFLCQPAVFWRRTLMDRIGLFDEKLNYALDYEYWLRAAQDHTFDYLGGKFLAGSRLHDETKTLSQPVPAHREILQVVQRYTESPKPLLNWLRHLSHYESCANTRQTDPAKDPRKHATLMITRLILNAKHYDINLPSGFLDELDRILRANGV